MTNDRLSVLPPVSWAPRIEPAASLSVPARAVRMAALAYAQDNQTTWLDWLAIDAPGRALRDFTRRLIAIRRAFPILSRGRFVVRTYNEELEVKDVAWLSPTGEEMTQEQWDDSNAKCFGMLLDGRAQESGILRRGDDATVLLNYNSHFDVVNFTLPAVPEGIDWEGLVDTNQPESPPSEFPFGTIYQLTGRSFAAFGLATSTTRRSLRENLNEEQLWTT